MTAKTNLTTYWRKGAKLDNSVLRKQIDRHISRHNKPIVFLFFNTCYLTEFDKNRVYIDLVKNHGEIVNIIAEEYRQFKQERLYIKPNAKILFLECPYISILEWNRNRKHPEPELFTDNQKLLEGMIKELNECIREINLPYNLPQLSKDMIFKVKKRSHHKQSHFISYSVLKDGVHPDNKISKLWLIRINNCASTINK